jgi:hypothetical protein
MTLLNNRLNGVKQAITIGSKTPATDPHIRTGSNALSLQLNEDLFQTLSPTYFR